MRFETPIAFILLLLIPLYLYIHFKIEKKRTFLPLPTTFIIKEIKSSFKVILLKFLLPLRILIITLFIFALARPQYGYEKIETLVKGVDIMLAVDTSDSMLAKDLGEKNRIETAKEVISNFIVRQKGNRLGLVVFSGTSFTLSPLTLDYEMISSAIKDIDVNTVKIDGTAIGDAIVNALYRFDYSNRNRNKVIILLTDGENNSGKVAPEKATGMAINKKVKIYTIGIGKVEGTPLIIKDPLTGKEKYSRDVFGNTIYSKINEEDLVKMANATNGYYFQALDKKSLENIYNKINMLEKAEVVTSKINNYSEKMVYFLIPALILLLIDFLLNKKFLTVVKL